MQSMHRLSGFSSQYFKEVNKVIKSIGQQWTFFDPSAFVIVKLQSYSFGNVPILNGSSKLCGMKIEYEDSKINQSFRCCIKIGGMQVGESTCPSKFEARGSAACKAMSFLSRVCPTIIIKDLSTYQEIEPVITPTQLKENITRLKHVSSERSSHTEWTSENEDELLKIALDWVFINYRHTPYHDDIIFSPSFTVRECDFIKSEGDKWGLRLSSFVSDSDQEKFIALSCYRTPLELVNFIRENGGETIRLQLIEATDSPNGNPNEGVLSKQDIPSAVTVGSSGSYCLVSDSPGETGERISDDPMHISNCPSVTKTFYINRIRGQSKVDGATSESDDSQSDLPTPEPTIVPTASCDMFNNLWKMGQFVESERPAVLTAVKQAKRWMARHPSTLQKPYHIQFKPSYDLDHRFERTAVSPCDYQKTMSVSEQLQQRDNQFVGSLPSAGVDANPTAWDRNAIEISCAVFDETYKENLGGKPFDADSCIDTLMKEKKPANMKTLFEDLWRIGNFREDDRPTVMKAVQRARKQMTKDHGKHMFRRKPGLPIPLLIFYGERVVGEALKLNLAM